MGQLSAIYRTPLGLLTDLYQLTMAYGYWKLGRADEQAVFHLFFRRPPFGGGYAIAAGLSHVIDLIADFRFEASDLEYLATLTGNDGQPLFEPAFLEYLGGLTLDCDVDAVPEGTVVFANEPLVRVRGPIVQGQLLETALLNLVNFQTLVATKAARVCMAAGDDAVLEFGLRRAQGVDGGLAASRAAYIGGCDATSNVLAGKLFGIPVRGTHAHSWVMSFDDEPQAFEAYAQAMPNNCVFLVDTYDTLVGVRHAIEVGRRLRQRGHEMVGIRLDSGDLAYLSIEARRLLDAAGFKQAAIVASNDLDEHLIQDLKRQGATIATWGVGTKLATAYDQPALGGVYKLGAIRPKGGDWAHRVKLSEQAIKTSIPGILQVRRFETADGYVADMIFDELTGPGDDHQLIDPKNPARRRAIDVDGRFRDLLVPITRDGKVCYEDEPLPRIRERTKAELAKV
ncbi:MAG: nicotinate phosphoribosyltransferase, partial [Planctomycetota bacterium]